MRKLTKDEYSAAMSYVLKEPEYNLFLIGNLENYGLDGPEAAAYTGESRTGNMLPYLLLDCRGSFIFYSRSPDFEASEVAGFLSGRCLHNLNGKLELIEKIIPYMKGLEIVPAYLAKLEEPPKQQKASGMRRLLEKDVPDILNLFNHTEEFAAMKTKTPEENLEDIRASLSLGGRMYGLFEQGVLAAVAGTTAENSMSAMVVSVATLPACRKRGYASALVSRLCGDCLREGMRFLCLFYDSPEAGRIYRRLGFKEVGQYAMVRSKKGPV